MTTQNRMATGLLLSSLVLTSTVSPALAFSSSGLGSATAGAELIARGGGGGARGGGGGGGGARFGGGGGGGGGSRLGGGGGGARMPQTGFQTAGGGLNRGSTTPAGGWSNRVGSGAARPSIDRPAVNRTGNRDLGGAVNRDWNRDLNRNVNRTTNRNVNRDINRNWNRTVNVNSLNVSPGWARAGWGVARPWNTGWYGGWATPTWGWWGARAAAWGIGTLATAAIINNAVDNAISNNVSYIVVPDSNYQLLYGTVAPSGSSTVSFAVTAEGSTYQLSADCNAGTINGQQPSNASEAELLNAASQVAYGST